MLPIAILAGGLATRLRPRTETVPKAMIEVAGTPFIQRQLDYLRGQGIGRVVLCVGHLGEKIQAAIGDGAMFGLEISYSFDGPMLLGTGGALRRARPLLGKEFFVLYGDSFLPIDFAAVERAFLASGKPALMTVMANADRWDKSNVLFREGRLVEYDKRTPRREMTHIDYGLSALTAQTLETYPADEAFELADLYHELSVTGQLAGHEVAERFYEIGSPAGLERTAAYFLSREKG